jgi:hypothetical protein
MPVLHIKVTSLIDSLRLYDPFQWTTPEAFNIVWGANQAVRGA